MDVQCSIGTTSVQPTTTGSTQTTVSTPLATRGETTSSTTTMALTSTVVSSISLLVCFAAAKWLNPTAVLLASFGFLGKLYFKLLKTLTNLKQF